MEDKSSIERLKKKLYSRSTGEAGPRKRRRLRDVSESVQTQWQPSPPPKKPRVNKSKALSGLLILSVFFFVGALALSAFFFFADRNTVSSENIEIEIQGPATIKGGEELVLQVLITNKNPTAIEGVDLLIEYPEGARSPEDLSEELLRSQESLGRLEAGERVQKTIRAVLFGEEGVSQIIATTIEYRIKDSNAIFYRDQSYEINLSSAPLSVLVDSVEEISSGQEVEFTVTVISNSDTVIEDALLTAQYPFGFEFQDSSPDPFAKSTVWELGDIEPEEEKVVRIRGKVLGENDEERVFRFAAGIRSKRDDSKLETAFVTVLRPVLIKRPFVGVNLAINGNTKSDPIVSRDNKVRADIAWVNNIPNQVFDAEVEVKILGGILDEKSITVQQGFYNSANNTILWDRETLPSLASLPEGGEGSVSFSFSPLLRQSGENFRTPTITLDITVRGKRLSERDVPETIESTVQRTIKVATDLDLGARVTYSGGPFTNTGSIPPKAETETTYTILWTAENSTNPVGDVTVSATLPSYMRWVGTVSPSTSQIDFNSIGGRITWNVGSISSYGSREVAFQVAFSPSISQIGKIPALITRQTIEGIDTFTTKRVGNGAATLTTDLFGDPSFPNKGGIVVE